MKTPDFQTGLILFAALGVDIFLIWSAKSKVVKSMWACFGVFFLLLVLLMAVWSLLYKDPSHHSLLLILTSITAAPFLAGVVLAHIVVMTDAE
jgi:hypothetical protein